MVNSSTQCAVETTGAAGERVKSGWYARVACVWAWMISLRTEDGMKKLNHEAHLTLPLMRVIVVMEFLAQRVKSK